MHRIVKTGISVFILILGISCGSSEKKKDAVLAKKQSELKHDQEEVGRLNIEIQKLQDEIAKLDPSSVKAEKPKLVAVAPLTKKTFVTISTCRAV